MYQSETIEIFTELLTKLSSSWYSSEMIGTRPGIKIIDCLLIGVLDILIQWWKVYIDWYSRHCFSSFRQLKQLKLFHRNFLSWINQRVRHLPTDPLRSRRIIFAIKYTCMSYRIRVFSIICCVHCQNAASLGHTSGHFTVRNNCHSHEIE